MTVTFHIEGHRCDCENPFECPGCRAATMNMSNANARALLEWLGLGHLELWLEEPLDATDLAARCRRRLWPEPRNQDPGKPTLADGKPIDLKPIYDQWVDPRNADKNLSLAKIAGAKFIDCGRRPGYLQERTRDLLAIAEAAAAQGKKITWG